MKKRKKLLFILIIISIFSVISLYKANKIVIDKTAEKTYDTITSIPKNKVGLLLGTTKFLQNGRVNLYYTYRINATVALYKAKKIDYILISGDNGTNTYDEPTTMKNDLITKGIPASRIYLDYAGFRTLDSIIRAKEIFTLQKFTIISQKFHNERAIFIAENKGINAIGFNARDVNIHYGLKTQIRERFARVKMIIDLLIGKQPKYLGKKIPIG
ncbi:vancomycin high temperature exclusion protein [Aquimarina hainanensis]|uniref:Vancomycin high temperature exclusion protein n=1 Tax=Aquimarina hainanensis TaxID=1578017 RepID=A0ABW5ND40_9FLAO